MSALPVLTALALVAVEGIHPLCLFERKGKGRECHSWGRDLEAGNCSPHSHMLLLIVLLFSSHAQHLCEGAGPVKAVPLAQLPRKVATNLGFVRVWAIFASVFRSSRPCLSKLWKQQPLLLRWSFRKQSYVVMSYALVLCRKTHLPLKGIWMFQILQMSFPRGTPQTQVSLQRCCSAEVEGLKWSRFALCRNLCLLLTEISSWVNWEQLDLPVSQCSYGQRNLGNLLLVLYGRTGGSHVIVRVKELRHVENCRRWEHWGKKRLQLVESNATVQRRLSRWLHYECSVWCEYLTIPLIIL